MTQRPKRLRDSPAAAPDAPSDTLIFNVSTLLQEAIGSERVYEIAAAPIDLESDPAAVDGSATMLRTDGSILVTATLSLDVAEQCATCLRPYGLGLSLELREEFWPEIDPLSHEPVEVPEEREGFPVVEGHLDLREAIRQYVLMARPMRGDCGAACPGPPSVPGVTVRRAAEAGSDPQRDQVAANGPPPIDSRWAALQRWRDDANGAGSAGSEQEES